MHFYTRRRKRAEKACRQFHGEIVASKSMSVLSKHEKPAFDAKLDSYAAEKHSIAVLNQVDDPDFAAKLNVAAKSTRIDAPSVGNAARGIENMKIKSEGEVLAEVRRRLQRGEMDKGGDRSDDDPVSPALSDDDFEDLNAQAKTMLANRARFGNVRSFTDLETSPSQQLGASAASAASAHTAVEASYGADEFDDDDDDDVDSGAENNTNSNNNSSRGSSSNNSSRRSSSNNSNIANVNTGHGGYGSDDFDDDDDDDDDDIALQFEDESIGQ
jgi:hypothetical protein